MNHEAIFEEQRPTLFGIAYRMLQSVGDAEDVCQDAWLRFTGKDLAELRDPDRYLTRIATRLCIDRLRAVERRREEYVGPWLPEPMPTPEPADHDGSLSMAFLRLLESLSPVERTVFLLRQVFDVDYSEVAEITGKSEVHCRQVLRRAKQKIDAGRPRFRATPDQQERVMACFAGALRDGDLEGLVAVLDEDAIMTSDGGGKATAARVPIHGGAAIARFLLGVAARAPVDMTTRWTPINGAPGVVVSERGVPTSVMAFEIDQDRIRSIYAIRNPEKLLHVRP